MKPLCKNEYTITLKNFSRELSTLPPLEEDEDDVWYDVECLFTKILVKETTDYIIDRIFVQIQILVNTSLYEVNISELT